jgi:hypothetical protein
MTTKKQIPPIVKLGAVLLSLTAFGVGFWHCHLGLKEMRPFNSENGSIFIAAIILLLLLISYFFAVSGQKGAKAGLSFYLICACFFIVFNLNFFYPSYLSRKLVTEEATLLNNTLQDYANVPLGDIDQKAVNDYRKLENLKGQIMSETRQYKFATNARQHLADFNSILNEYGIIQVKEPSFAGVSLEQQAEHIEPYLNKSIEDFQVKKVTVKDAENYLKGKDELKNLQKEYTPKLDSIIKDDSRIALSDVKNHPQIKTLSSLVNAINNNTDLINKSREQKEFPQEKLGGKEGGAHTRHLGEIEHTLTSIGERINRIDTWAMILLCLFIDLLVPLAIYVFIRKKDDEDDNKGFFNSFRSNRNINN